MTIEALLAKVLNYGTSVSTGIITLGVILALTTGPSNAAVAMKVTSVGIAVLILLPVIRVIFMLAAFLRQRDYRFSAFAGIVLLIILLGFAIGAATA